MSESCFHCGGAHPQHRCSRCHLALYCNEQCQKEDWKAFHQYCCRPKLPVSMPMMVGGPMDEEIPEKKDPPTILKKVLDYFHTRTGDLFSLIRKIMEYIPWISFRVVVDFIQKEDTDSPEKQSMIMQLTGQILSILTQILKFPIYLAKLVGWFVWWLASMTWSIVKNVLEFLIGFLVSFWDSVKDLVSKLFDDACSVISKGYDLLRDCDSAGHMVMFLVDGLGKKLIWLQVYGIEALQSLSAPIFSEISVIKEFLAAYIDVEKWNHRVQMALRGLAAILLVWQMINFIPNSNIVMAAVTFLGSLAGMYLMQRAAATLLKFSMNSMYAYLKEELGIEVEEPDGDIPKELQMMNDNDGIQVMNAVRLDFLNKWDAVESIHFTRTLLLAGAAFGYKLNEEQKARVHSMLEKKQMEEFFVLDENEMMNVGWPWHKATYVNDQGNPVEGYVVDFEETAVKAWVYVLVQILCWSVITVLLIVAWNILDVVSRLGGWTEKEFMRKITEKSSRELKDAILKEVSIPSTKDSPGHDPSLVITMSNIIENDITTNKGESKLLTLSGSGNSSALTFNRAAMEVNGVNNTMFFQFKQNASPRLHELFRKGYGREGDTTELNAFAYGAYSGIVESYKWLRDLGNACLKVVLESKRDLDMRAVDTAALHRRAESWVTRTIRGAIAVLWPAESSSSFEKNDIVVDRNWLQQNPRATEAEIREQSEKLAAELGSLSITSGKFFDAMDWIYRHLAMELSEKSLPFLGSFLISVRLFPLMLVVCSLLQYVFGESNVVKGVFLFVLGPMLYEDVRDFAQVVFPPAVLPVMWSAFAAGGSYLFWKYQEQATAVLKFVRDVGDPGPSKLFPAYQIRRALFKKYDVTAAKPKPVVKSRKNKD